MAAQNPRRVKKAIQNVARIFAGRPDQYVIPTRLNHKTPPADIATLPTGLRSLDKTLGIGGLPGGRITELMGPTTTSGSDGVMCIAAKIGATIQRKQHIVTIIDMSHNFDPWQAERCGLIAPHLLLARPDTVFAALSTMESAARNEGLIVISMGVVSQILSHADAELLITLLRRLRSITRQSESVFLFITSLLENNPFGSTNYPVGFPLAELADVRLWVQDENWTYRDGITTAYKASLAVIKNRLASPGMGTDIRIKFSSFNSPQ